MTEDIRCPECGSATVVRTAKKGPDAGLKFHVCTRYPDCKGKVPITEQVDAEEPIGEEALIMKRRNPFGLIVLTVVTLGIYAIVWYVVTKREMNTQGAQIPTAWLLIIPLVNIYWLWKFCEGVETVTKGAMSVAVAFLLLWLLDVIGLAIVQNSLNKVAT